MLFCILHVWMCWCPFALRGLDLLNQSEGKKERKKKVPRGANRYLRVCTHQIQTASIMRRLEFQTYPGVKFQSADTQQSGDSERGGAAAGMAG